MSELARTAQKRAGKRQHVFDPADASSLVEQLPALVAFLDAGQYYRYVNREYEEFFGRPRHEILGTTILSLTGAEHHSVAEGYIERVLQGERVSFSSALRRADGSSCDVEVTFNPRLNPAGKVDGFLSLVRDVTEWSTLSEAQQRLAAIVDSSDDAIVSKTFEGVITSWNRAAERIFGYTPEEAVGKHITLIIPRERHGEEDEVLRRLRLGEKIEHFETERRAKDGRKVYVSLTVSPVRNARGELIGASKIARDITQRKNAEEALLASEEQFRTLANTIPNLAWMAHPDGNIFWYNGRWYDYTGKTFEEMQGWGWQSVHDPAVLPSVLKAWEHSLASGEPFEMIFPLRGVDGRFRSFLTRVEPITDSKGNVIRWFGTNTDITSQQEAEEREKKAKETAELLNRVGPLLAAELDSEKLTQKITDIATAVVRAEFGALFHTVRDADGESLILYTLSGAPRDAFASFPMPRNTHVFGPTFHGEGVVRSDDITKDPRYGKNPPYEGMPEGHLPVRSYLAVPVRSRTGAVLGGLFFGHSREGVFDEDAEKLVTGIAAQAAIALDNASLFEEVKRSSEAVLRSNENLKRVNEDLNQFAYSASHDLREPLRMVSIYTQFLNRKLESRLEPETQVYMDNVIKGAERLEALLRDLLAYTQAVETAGPAVVEIEANEALDRALSNLEAVIEETGATITVARLPIVRITPVHLTQLLQNLIGNALKYRREAAPRIDVTAVRREGEWEFQIADNGIGIEEQYKEHIFGIFKRLHKNEDYPGTGIGLAICQRIVQRSGGRIWVDSEFGRGSTFYFTLPAGE